MSHEVFAIARNKDDVSMVGVGIAKDVLHLGLNDRGWRPQQLEGNHLAEKLSENFI